MGRHHRVGLPHLRQADAGAANGVDLHAVPQELCLGRTDDVVRPLLTLRTGGSDRRVMAHLLSKELELPFVTVLKGLPEDRVEWLVGALHAAVRGNQEGTHVGVPHDRILALGSFVKELGVLHDLRHLLCHRKRLHNPHRHRKQRCDVHSHIAAEVGGHEEALPLVVGVYLCDALAAFGVGIHDVQVAPIIVDQAGNGVGAVLHRTGSQIQQVGAV
mmetsp:Transcript_6855/g.19331  ORF Transcript_6855/g.19331 Transcript_6855/m.19331 type:complete len:216 (-) Transcript_6855:371-1018(-)